jgi:glutamyl-tRNA synthetase
MSVPEMIELFSSEHLSKNAAVFDMKKLEWMNGQHLSRMPAEKLAAIIVPSLVDAGLSAPGDFDTRRDWYFSLLDLLKVRARTTDEIVRLAAPYLKPTVEYEPEAVAKTWKDRAASADALLAVREALADAEPWEVAELETRLRSLVESKGVSAGKLFGPLRVALTGLTASPGIFEVLTLLGRDRSVERIDSAVRYITGNG